MNQNDTSCHLNFQVRFPVPPHPIAVRAAELLQEHLPSCIPAAYDFYARDGGKMFGVLVVLTGDQRIRNCKHNLCVVV